VRFHKLLVAARDVQIQNCDGRCSIFSISIFMFPMLGSGFASGDSEWASERSRANASGIESTGQTGDGRPPGTAMSFQGLALDAIPSSFLIRVISR
jgi:hypothetical protein